MANLFDGRRSLIAALLGLGTCWATAGKVETLDGNSFEGKIQFESGNTLVVTHRNSAAVRVPLTNLLRADFSQPTNRNSVSASPRMAQAAFDENKGALPLPWRGQDVGAVSKPGAVNHYHGT